MKLYIENILIPEWLHPDQQVYMRTDFIEWHLETFEPNEEINLNITVINKKLTIISVMKDNGLIKIETHLPLFTDSDKNIHGHISGNTFRFGSNEDPKFAKEVFHPYQKHILFGNHNCPLCGNRGEDLIFAFYCSSKQCINYKM